MSTTDLHQRYRGTYVATVLGVDDPDGLGRVRISTDQVDDTEDAPLWATIARPLGGDGSSAFFTPRERDQVIISYLHGDPRHPVVLGYAHFDKRKPTGVGPRKHAIVTKAGSVTFDEDANKMILAIGGTRIELSPAGVAITADSLTFNGSGLVRDGFFATFLNHKHDGSGSVTPPLVPGGDTSA